MQNTQHFGNEYSQNPISLSQPLIQFFVESKKNQQQKQLKIIVLFIIIIIALWQFNY